VADRTIKVIDDYKFLCDVNKQIVSYHKGGIYKQDSLYSRHEKIVDLPLHIMFKIAAKIRPLERLLRLEPRLALRVDDEHFLLSYHGCIYRIDLNSGELIQEHKYRRNMNNPLSFCRNEEKILYGEYFGNTKRESVSVYSREKNRWEKIYTFPAGEILHIHQIIYDKYRDCYWVLTGDDDSESGIWCSDTKFEFVRPIFKGKQLYRSCFLVPYENYIIYATDTPIEENYLLISEIHGGKWSEPKILHKIPGPCIYGKILSDECFVIATSVEPDSNLPIYRYRISYKLGEGVEDRYSHIIKWSMDTGICELAKGRKDVLPMNLFQFGNYQFPECGTANGITATGQSISGQDGKTVLIYSEGLKDRIE